MSTQKTDLHQWFDSPPGRYLLQWEQARFDEAVADVFGYYSLQLGMPMLPGLRANRMPHRWLALGEGPDTPVQAPPQAGAEGPAPVHLRAHAVALPFAQNTLDLLVLPHTLELSHDPHTALREAARVLVPEGQLVISGLNPASLWGLRQQCGRLQGHASALYLPEHGPLIAPWRLRDWLRLLDFEVEEVRFGCYRPAVHSSAWLQRWAWLDGVGERLWPILGAAYFVVAIKRVHGLHLLKPDWRRPAARASASAAVTGFTPPRQDL